MFYFGVVTAGLKLYGFLYYETNTVAISGPDFDHMSLSSSFQDITSTDSHWKITYEKPVNSSFTGLVRHVSVDRVDMFPILSHDFLVTTGDYANPDLVTTFVSDHHFRWRTSSSNALMGSINLLHIVPVSKDIYTTLIQVKNGDQVTIGGREISRIDYYDQSDAFKAFWEDSGCNSIFVTSVNILNPVP